jgi:hypothetical protein
MTILEKHLINCFSFLRLMYFTLESTVLSHKDHMVLWKMKVPLRIKIFMWYLKRGVVLTKDNLASGIGVGINCVFCLHLE